MTDNGNAQYAIRTTQYDNIIEVCLIFLIIFSPLAYGSVQPWAVAIFEIIAALMAITWIFKMFRSGTLEFARTPLNGFVILFIFYVYLQFLIRSFLPTTYYLLPTTFYSWATKTELLKIISYALIFLVVLNTIKTRRQITRILSIIITIGFIMSIFYLMRYFGVKAPRGIINSDHFSGYLGMIIPLTLGFLFTSHQSPVTSHQSEHRALRSEHRFLLFFCVIVMSAALFFTMSRGGMFSFIVALLFMAGLTLTRKSIKKKGWIISAVAIFIILTIAWLGATPVIERILSIKVEIASRYFGGRLPIWQGALNIIKDYPIFGIGLGTFNYLFPKYQPAEIISKHYTHAHSDILEFISETGLIFSLLATLYSLLIIRYLFRLFRNRHDPWVVGMSIGFLGSLASISVHSFVDFNLHIPANAILFTLILALTLIVLNLKRDRFGERVIFRKMYFRFSAIGIVPEGGFPLTIPYSLRFIFYLLTIAIISIFAVACVRPALADYYFQQATSSVIGTVPEGDCPLIALLHKAISLDSTNAKYHYYLGKSYSELRAYSLRLAAYEKAVELNPTNSKYHQSLAWTYGILADLNRHNTHKAKRMMNLAYRHFQQAIRLEPNNPYRYRAYAIWLFNHSAAENTKKGITNYRKAIELKPKLAEEAFNRIPAPETLKIAHQRKEQIGHRQRKETVKQYRRRASQYLKQRNYSAALEEYMKALELDPRDDWTYYRLGRLYEEWYDQTKAEEFYKKTLEINPEHSWAYYNLAKLYESQGRLSDAKQMWQRILELKNSDPDAERIAKRELKKY
jgi:tetratricopeptide (TPR) repeat protein/O-antigen ligase